MTSPRDIDWPAVAAAFARVWPPTRIHAAVRGWMAAAPHDEPLAVAFSGGADSLAALLAMAGLRNAEWELWNAEARKSDDAEVRSAVAPPPEARPEAEDPNQANGNRVEPLCNPQSAIRNSASLIALHFNHKLRGAASDADATFCQGVCASLGLRLVVGEASWPAGSDVSEAGAREARFAFFAEAMRTEGARALVLGHQRDDVVETMLLRLSRGSGSRGLAAPRPVQRRRDGTVRLRPLLGASKEDLIAALRAAGAPWREDETNHGDTYFRNRVRRQVVPAWTAAAPTDLGTAVARSRELLEEEDEALEAWADRLLPEDLTGALPLTLLRAAPIAIIRRGLYRWLVAHELGDRLGRAAFDRLLDALRTGRDGRFSAGTGGFLTMGNDELKFESATADASGVGWGAASLPVPGSLFFPDGSVLHATVRALEGELRRRIGSGALDDGRTAFLGFTGQPPACFAVRSWQPGDRYAPLGSVHAIKLQDQFVNRGIPRSVRHGLPVVARANGSILWVPGLPPAQSARVVDDSSGVVQLTYQPARPKLEFPHVR